MGSTDSEKVRLRSASLTFAAQRPGSPDINVVQGINLHLCRGEILCLCGPSGCGKTSLLSVIAGLLEPTSGEVRRDVEKPWITGFVFQSPSLVPWLTVMQNTVFGSTLSPRNGSKQKRAALLLHRYGLAGFEDAFPRTLSGGMQQRVAIIRAVVAGAEVLLLDEPFSDSDIPLRMRLQRELHDVVEGENIAAVLVTHDLEEAVRLSDRILVLTERPGRIKAEIEIPVPRAERLDPAGDETWGMDRYRHQLLSLLMPPSDGRPAERSS